MVSNLLSNAIKYSPSGGTVRVSAQRMHGHVRVSVSDPGIGIPLDQHDRVFSRFFRAQSTDTRDSGLGLGLAPRARSSPRTAARWGSRASKDRARASGSSFPLAKIRRRLRRRHDDFQRGTPSRFRREQGRAKLAPAAGAWLTGGSACRKIVMVSARAGAGISAARLGEVFCSAQKVDGVERTRDELVGVE